MNKLYNQKSNLKKTGLYAIAFMVVLCHNLYAQDNNIDTADSLYLSGNFSKAIELYKELDKEIKVNDRIAKSYVAIGNYDKALVHYEEAIVESPDDALLKYEYAKLLSKTKRFEEAKIAFNDLVYLDYKNPNYHYELGLVLEQLKDSTSMNRFVSAYQLDNNHQKAIFKIAKHYLVKGRNSASHKLIDVGLSSYPNNVELVSLKAQNFYWQEKYEDAAKWFEKLIELGESSEFIHEKLSLCYYHLYDYEKAIDQRLKVIAINPQDGLSYYVVGTYYDNLQNYQKAEEYIIKGIALLDRPMGAEYRKLGTVYNQQKKYKEAIEALKMAVSEDPSDSSSAFFLARSMEVYYGDTDAKIKVYENYKIKYPDSPFNAFVDRRIKELKEEDFLNGESSKDTIKKG